MAQLADQRPHVTRDLWLARSVLSAFPSPLELQAAAMPGQNSFGLDDHEGAPPAQPQPRNPDPEDSITRTQSGPCSGTPLQYPPLRAPVYVRNSHEGDGGYALCVESSETASSGAASVSVRYSCLLLVLIRRCLASSA